MKLGMNVQRLEGQRLGVGRYLEYLIRDWSSMLMPSEELTLFFRRPLGDGAAPRARRLVRRA